MNGGRMPTGLDAVEWIRRGVELGAGEILLTSMDRDGTEDGYELELTRAASEAVDVPVIASGGRREPGPPGRGRATRAAPTRCCAPRSSTTASTACARRRSACATRGSRCGSRAAVRRDAARGGGGDRSPRACQSVRTTNPMKVWTWRGHRAGQVAPDRLRAAPDVRTTPSAWSRVSTSNACRQRDCGPQLERLAVRAHLPRSIRRRAWRPSVSMPLHQQHEAPPAVGPELVPAAADVRYERLAESDGPPRSRRRQPSNGTSKRLRRSILTLALVLRVTDRDRDYRPRRARPRHPGHGPAAAGARGPCRRRTWWAGRCATCCWRRGGGSRRGRRGRRPRGRRASWRSGSEASSWSTSASAPPR